jgi:hypothetical protein
LTGQWLRMTRVGGSSPVTAAGPCRIHTGFPILPARKRGTSLTVRAASTLYLESGHDGLEFGGHPGQLLGRPLRLGDRGGRGPGGVGDTGDVAVCSSTAEAIVVW